MNDTLRLLLIDNEEDPIDRIFKPYFLIKHSLTCWIDRCGWGEEVF